MRYAAGVDVGSTQTKAVVIDEDGNILGRSLIVGKPMAQLLMDRHATVTV